MSKIRVMLEDAQGRYFEIETEENIVAEAAIIEYRKNLYVYSGIKNHDINAEITEALPTYVYTKQPAFVG